MYKYNVNQQREEIAMIYAAYAGTGKSTFCQEHPEAIDLICMPFKYTNLSEVSEKIDSGRKGEYVSGNCPERR